MARISRSTALSECHAQITKGARQLHSSGSATCGSPLPDHCPLKRSTSLACGWRRSRTALARRGVHRPRIPNDTLRGSTVSPFWGAGASQLIMYSRPLVPAPYAELGNSIPPSLLARADEVTSETVSSTRLPLLLRAVYGSSEKASALQHFRQLSEGYLLWPRGHRRHRTIVAETVVAIVRGVSSANASVHPTHGAERVDGNGALLWQLCADMSR